MAYIEPSGVDTASLRIENQGPAIFGYELEAVTYENAAACSGKLRLTNARALPRGVTHTVQVAAGADFTLTLRGSGGGATRTDSCALAGTFTPGAGERYVAIFRADGSKCDLLFLRQQTAPGGARRYGRDASYRPRQEPACL
ncbi:MAG TPA: hypothetical protein VGJ74_02020 [Burkholderiales bacterium]